MSRPGKGIRRSLNDARRQLKGACTSIGLARTGIYGTDDRRLLELLKRIRALRDDLAAIRDRVGRPVREERERAA